VCLHYNSKAPLDLVKELSEYNVKVHLIRANLSSASECERVADEAANWSPTGGIDILINNAGTGKVKPWIEVPKV
jgi:short-subunit dehydrogenase